MRCKKLKNRDVHWQSNSTDVVFKIWSSKSFHLSKGPSPGWWELVLEHLNSAAGLVSRWEATDSASSGEGVYSGEQRLGMK